MSRGGGAATAAGPVAAPPPPRAPLACRSLLSLLVAACAPQAPGLVPPSVAASPPAAAPVSAARRGAPQFPPEYAYQAGLMPLASTGVDRFRLRHPGYDGGGVLIGILDSGVDPGVSGLLLTPGGAPKLLDLRDFSGEGEVALGPAQPGSDGTVRIGGITYQGAGRIARVAVDPTWHVGALCERALGRGAAADLNGDGTATDCFGVVVVKASDGWVVFIDGDGDRSFEDERPLHDYAAGRETIALGTRPFTLAVNLTESGGAPALDFVFDNAGHGTHIAGIAAGHDLYGVRGFDGVAPGAQLLGLKIANNGRGGVAVSGALLRALAYAARYADTRGLRLVLTLSVGVGSEVPGEAAVDSLVDAFLAAHPDIVLVASAGNDGPGLSTAGLPGSADLVVAAGASVPGIFAHAGDGTARRTAEVVGPWSARGGALAKPDLVAPGIAFSSVPAFDAGNEVKGGTSMAAPEVAGLAACLVSAMVQEGRPVHAADVVAALRASARALPEASVLDEGAGEPRLGAAYQWLEAGHQGSQYGVRGSAGGSAAWFPDGLSGADSVAVFHVRHLAGLRAAEFALRTDVAWALAPPTVTAGALETAIPVRYASDLLRAPGAYVGTVTAWNPTDTLAGPLFRLVTTVVVPHRLDEAALDDPASRIAGGDVVRYFLRIPRPGATLLVSVTLADSLQEHASARVYEPGRPLQSQDALELGAPNPGAGRILVPSDDAVAGVYELDLWTSGPGPATARVRAELAPLTLDTVRDGLEATNPGAETVRTAFGEGLLGAARVYEVVGPGTPAETLRAEVPTWASAVALAIDLPPEEWASFTGFGVAAYDTNGTEVSAGPLAYAVGRERFDLPDELRGHPLAIALWPAFARAEGAPWHARVEIEFLLARPLPVGPVRPITVVAGGRVALPEGAPPPLVLPSGFRPVMIARLRTSGAPDAVAVRRLVAPGAP